ncbi:MAG: GAF domain-containing protein, partial [Chloroflexota bacterium]|nr:GAF domain-containing protein [Chloroflexota bacterium]
MRAGAKKTTKPDAKKVVPGAPKRAASKPLAVPDVVVDARQQLAAVSAVMKALADPAVSVDAVADMIVAAATRLAGAENAAFIEVVGDDRVVAATYGDAPARRGDHVTLDPDSMLGRAATTGKPWHVRDSLREPNFAGSDPTKRRTRLAMPIVRRSGVIGVLMMSRGEPGGFDDSAVALVETFADQLAVAIDNARLLKETKESLDRESAMAEVLRAINDSAFDLDPVFETILRLAARLCEADWAGAFRVENGTLHVAALTGASSEFAAVVREGPTAITRGSLGGRVVLERRVVHITDVLEDQEYAGLAGQRAGGFRTMLGVPVLRTGEPVAVLNLLRNTVRPFTAREIALVASFADQAAIAIENVRLFNQTKGALERQTAMSEVLDAINNSAFDLERVLITMLEKAMALCAADNGGIVQFEGGHGRMVAVAGPPEHVAVAREVFAAREIASDRGSLTGRVLHAGKTVQIADMLNDPEYVGIANPTGGKTILGDRTALGVPLVRDGAVFGAILLRRQRVAPFTAAEVSLVEAFAAQAVIAIENARLFNETKEALEQQTATSDLLKVISRSTEDIQPVLDAVVENAVRLGGADSAFIQQIDGDTAHLTASAGTFADRDAFLEYWRHRPVRRGRDSLTGRVLAERKPVQIPDTSADAEYEARAADTGGVKRAVALLGVPLLREEELIGVLVARRNEPRPFTDQEIGLLETFAGQAAIAIENVRLFNETKEALAQQTAVADVLKVIGSSVFDLQPTLAAIVEAAKRLCDADGAVIWSPVADEWGFAAGAGAGVRLTGTHFKPETEPGTVVARCVAERSTIHSRDARRDGLPDPEQSRTRLAVPVLRSGQVAAVIVITREAAGGFNDREVELVETFADQAAIAIENVRLFNETKEALDQQTATSDILSVIADSLTDVQPVLDAIAASAARFCAAENVSVILQGDAGLLQVQAHVGTLDTRTAAWPIDRTTVSGRSIVEGRTVQVADLQAAAEDFPLGQAQAMTLHERTTLAAPLIRDGRGIGALLLRRSEVRPFTDKQVELVKLFADQAVIAIENVRLFNETTEALERQTATAEILRAISGSPTDVQPVLEAIAENAVRFCGAEDALLLLREGDRLAGRAHS